MGKHPFNEDLWKERLRESGLRITSARIDILRTLHESALPMTAQDVLTSIESRGPADRVTVYRTLNSLVETGIAHKVDPGDRVWRYGLLAADHHQHAHFVCDACGTIRCLEDALITVNHKGKIGGDRFKVKQQDVYLHGTCETCFDGDAGEAKKKPGSGSKPG